MNAVSHPPAAATPAPVQPKHKFFSLARVLAIATNTLLELIRLKVFYFMLLFAVAIIGSSAFTVKFTFQEQFQVLKDVSLGSMSIFSWLLATLSTAMLLPKDVEDRTLYTILAKPVPRFEYLIGKLAGVLFMLGIALALMTVVFGGVLYAREQIVLAETARQYSPGPELDAALQQVRAATFNNNLIPGVLLIYLKAAIVAVVTLLISTFATSWIFTILVSMMVYFIGHVQPIAREYWLASAPGAANPSALLETFLGFVAIIFPDFQLFTIVDDIAAGNVVPPELFLKAAGFGLGYVLIYTLVAHVIFSQKEL